MEKNVSLYGMVIYKDLNKNKINDEILIVLNIYYSNYLLREAV